MIANRPTPCETAPRSYRDVLASKGHAAAGDRADRETCGGFGADVVGAAGAGGVVVSGVVEVTLLPCPFCGYDAGWEGKGSWRVKCTSVTCEALGPWCLTQPQAAFGWNTRALTAAQDRIRVLEEALGRLSFAAYDYAGNYLLDEREDPSLCCGANQHERIVALFNAIEVADLSLERKA